MSALALAATAALGVHLLVTTPSDTGGPRRPGQRAARRRIQEWLAQTGLAEVDHRALAIATPTVCAAGAALGLALFGSLLPALLTGALVAGVPAATLRRRRQSRLAVAQEAWPRIIEEIRVLTGAAGRSVPQALFEAGARAPAELRPAFTASHRTWTLTTDLTPTLRVLKDRMADPTCDATCETLLVAHQLGGVDLDHRLEALAADRRLDAQCRREAQARQAGVRFARRFVVLVPLGMAAAGLSVGDGRAAYRTPMGQLAVLLGLTVMAGCWLWAGRILRLPDEQRVLVG